MDWAAISLTGVHISCYQKHLYDWRNARHAVLMTEVSIRCCRQGCCDYFILASSLIVFLLPRQRPQCQMKLMSELWSDILVAWKYTDPQSLSFIQVCSFLSVIHNNKSSRIDRQCQRTSRGELWKWGLVWFFGYHHKELWHVAKVHWHFIDPYTASSVFACAPQWEVRSGWAVEHCPMELVQI